jgi:hypothetical protein
MSAQQLGDLARTAGAGQREHKQKKPRKPPPPAPPPQAPRKKLGKPKGGPPPEETLSQFASDLFEVIVEVPRGLKDVVAEAAERVVDGAKANVRRTAPIHNAGAYKGIDYEVYDRDGDIWGEVGYNPKLYRPAHLGNLLEFGGGGDPSPPHWDLALALKAEARNYEDKVGDYGEVLLETYWSADPGIKKRFKK